MEDLYRSRANLPSLDPNHSAPFQQKFEEHLVTSYSNILEFQARALCYLFKHPVTRLFSDMFKQDGWDKLLKDIHESENSTMSFTALIDKEEMRSRLEELRKEQEEDRIWAKLSARDEKAKKLLQTLYTCPYRDRKEKISERVPGTCEWFTEHSRFKNWDENQRSSLLWVSADPGCGKSVLVKYLVDHILLSTSKRTTCYFFFKDDIDFPDQKSATNAISAILRQLFLAKPCLLRDSILDKVETDGDKFTQSFDDLWSTLTSVAANHNAGDIVCILDALDECQDSERSKLIRAVTNLYVTDSEKFSLKFLLTSRPYDHIRREFRDLENRLPTIHLSGEDETEVKNISRDIGLVIQNRVECIGKRKSLQPDECEFLQNQLTFVPQRTYLWVSHTLDVIENIPGFTKGRIRREIRKIPSTVGDAYNKILDRSSDIERARRLLHIVCAARRPLSLKEMSLIMAIEETHKSYDEVMQELEPEERFRATLRDLCGLFVIIIDEKIYLLHQTAKEFLVWNDCSASLKDLSHLNSQNIPLKWKHSLQPVESNRILAERCIWYLTLDFVETHLSVLLNYPALNWDAHFRVAGIRSEEAIAALAQSLCETSSKRYKAWSTLYASKSDAFPESASSLTIASFLGLEAVVKLLLETGKVEVDSKDSKYGQTPLSWAARNGYEAVVKLLLESGKADVDSRDKSGQTPLSWAAQNGHEAVVKLLLERGKAGVDLKDKFGRTPLSWAAQMVVKLLLKSGKADVDSESNSGPTPLSWAARNGHEVVVKLLLESGKADVDSKDKSGQTPLSLAARNGHEAVVKLLLERGKADVDSKDKFGQTPLSWASQMGQETVVKLLLESEDVGVDSKSKSGPTPLSWAARNGHDTVVKLLLESGKADVDSKDKYGHTPLSLAAWKGHEVVVKLLLESGKADVDSKSNSGQTPLSWAAEKGHETVVKLLLESGNADVDSKDKYGQTPLWWAEKGHEKGHGAVVKLLLQRGKADVDSKDKYGQMPLSWAAENGHKVLNLLPAHLHCS